MSADPYALENAEPNQLDMENRQNTYNSDNKAPGRINPRNQQNSQRQPVYGNMKPRTNSFKLETDSALALNSDISIIEKNLKLYKTSLKLISRAYIMT